jgi:3-methyladenine DNA glycosylase Mpg
MITQGKAYRDDEIVTAPRIGVTKAADWPLRWYVAESEYVSVRERVGGQASRVKSKAPRG